MLGSAHKFAVLWLKKRIPVNIHFYLRALGWYDRSRGEFNHDK